LQSRRAASWAITRLCPCRSIAICGLSSRLSLTLLLSPAAAAARSKEWSSALATGSSSSRRRLSLLFCFTTGECFFLTSLLECGLLQHLLAFLLALFLELSKFSLPGLVTYTLLLLLTSGLFLLL
jgi:hypothetical protein